MFNMKKVGRKIALLRKEKDLTQMELADRLNISYQAVSNWERGETMPDISKLPEIALILNTSIDNILDDNATITIINNIVNEELSSEPIDIEEFKSIAPILKPTQINKISNQISETSNISDLIEYIPFVNKDIADKIAKKCIENEQILLDELLPFISIECANNLVEKALELNYPISILLNALPFINKNVANKIAKKCSEKNDLLLDELFPFISSDVAEELLTKRLEES